MNTGAIIFSGVKKLGGIQLFLVKCASGVIKEGDVLYKDDIALIRIVEVRPISKKSKELTKGVTGGLIVEFLSDVTGNTLNPGTFLVAKV